MPPETLAETDASLTDSSAAPSPGPAAPIPGRDLPAAALWDLLTPEEQEQAAVCFWVTPTASVPPEVRHWLEELLARINHFRLKFVQKRPLDWKAEQILARARISYFEPFLDYVLGSWFVTFRSELIEAVLGALGTPHDAGKIPQDAPRPSVPDLCQALESLRGSFTDRDLAIYFGLDLCFASKGFWENLPAAALEAPFQDLFYKVFSGETAAGGTDEAVPGETATDTEDSEPDAPDEFTTLDTLLIRSAVAAANDTEGALSPDSLEDLVQEVIALNSERHHSHFHLGYLDALLSRDLRDQQPGSNLSRRTWHFTGYLLGRLRSGSALALTPLLETHVRIWTELLEEGPSAARARLLRPLFTRLADEGAWDQAARLLQKAPLPAQEDRAFLFCREVYEHAAKLLRSGHPDEAARLLEALLKRLRNLKLKNFAVVLEPDCLRKLGQAHLRQGNFTRARELLEAALERPGLPGKEKTLSDLGIAEAGFRSLDALLPRGEPDRDAPVVQALEKRRDRFEAALAESDDAANAHFVLGLIAFHRNENAAAERHLVAARSGMLSDEAAYQSVGLLDWARFLLAIVTAEALEPGRGPEIRNLAEAALHSRIPFPLPLWERFLLAVSTQQDFELAEDVMRRLLETRGHAATALLKDSGLLERSREFRTVYRQRLETEEIGPGEHTAELQSLLHASMHTGKRAESEDILDALQTLAGSHTSSRAAMLKLLEKNRSRLSGVWNDNEIDFVLTDLLEREGLIADCTETLRRIFYRQRADADLEGADETLDYLRLLAFPETGLAEMKAQLDHLRPDTPAENERSLAGVRVLYVGGNETQQRYEAAIRKALAKEAPELSVTFSLPGWTSNWNAPLERLIAGLHDYDVVVMSNFVRTLFGRGLRAACGNHEIPWRACTGHGRDSIQRAILNAARSVPR